ncbi:MAG: cytochrome c family protein [Rhodovibrionaceae bacterium]
MSLELNKTAAAVLTAGVVAMTAGFIANLLVHPQELEENVYVIAGSGDGGAASAPEEEQLASVIPLLGEADPANGESLSRACTACHTFDEGGANKVGPNLWNIVGADHAHKEDFNYSDAIAGMSGQAWNYEELNAFLANPRGYAPGTKMTYGGMRKVEDRADMIAWLRSLSGSPQPLPTPEEVEAATQEASGGEEAESEGGEGEGGEGEENAEDEDAQDGAEEEGQSEDGGAEGAESSDAQGQSGDDSGASEESSGEQPSSEGSESGSEEGSSESGDAEGSESEEETTQ